MKCEIIDTSSAFVPIGRIFIGVQRNCDDENQFLKTCLELDEYAISGGESSQIELSSFSEEVKSMLQDIDNSAKESIYLPMINSVIKVFILPHATESAGGSYLAWCTNDIFYIN